MFEKGKSGNPGGQWRDKPFREALRIELAAAEDHKQLRGIARKLIEAAAAGELQAIKEIADRIDGKPAQESTVTIDDKRDATDWTRDELVAFLNDAKPGGKGTAKANGRERKVDPVH